jgi:ubiquinone biosynthesis accessory factor UbiJ
MIDRGAAAGLNHLLEQQPWATDRLKAFAGQCVEFRCPPLPDLRLGILPDGFLGKAGEDKPSSLVVRLAPGALPLLLARDESALKQVEIEGSADLASTVQHLFRHLTWDYEEDLSRLFGDIVAHRLASGGRAFVSWQREATTRLAENLAEYWTEEQPLLARPADVEKFCREADALRDDAARLEKRIERLEGPGKR